MSLQDLLAQLDEIIARLRRVQTGDYILASDHNDLVDASKKVRDILYSIKSYVDTIHESTTRTENKVSGIAKAVVDPSGKYSPYRTIADALSALDQDGVQAAVVVIVPPDDINTYPQVLESKSVELKNIKFIYIDGRFYPITFYLDADFWIKTNADTLVVILDKMNIVANGGAPSTLFYSPPMFIGEVIILDTVNMFLYSEREIDGETYRHYTNLLWTDSQSNVTATITVMNGGRPEPAEIGGVHLGHVLYAPYGTKSIYMIIQNAGVRLGTGFDIYNRVYSYELEWKDIYVFNGYLNMQFRYIEDIIMTSSTVRLSSSTSATIGSMYAIGSKITINAPLLAEGITLNRGTIHGSYIEKTGNVKIIDPIITNSIIDGADPLTLQGENYVFFKECTITGDIELHVVYSSGRYPVISALYSESGIDLSGVPSGAKVLLLSSVVDRTKINDPNNVLLSNGANIDISTWTVF